MLQGPLLNDMDCLNLICGNFLCLAYILPQYEHLFVIDLISEKFVYVHVYSYFICDLLKL